MDSPIIELRQTDDGEPVKAGLRDNTEVVPIPQNPTISTIRRKPKVTYQSPSLNGLTNLRIETSVSRPLSLKVASTSSNINSNRVSSPTGMKRIELNVIKPITKRARHPMGPPLPLYHPLGRLALSLPELDPRSFGLPSPARLDESVRRSSARARRPAAKLRDAEEEEPPAVAVIAAVAAREVKEKASPRKRRSGGTSGGSKRKRKEDEDGDATYPAKRSRVPRGASGTDTGVPSNPPAEAERASIEPAVIGVESPVELDTVMDVQEAKKRPERRSMRSRGAISRRNSSASEATATSVSVSIAAGAGRKSKVKGDDGEAKEVEEDEDEGTLTLGRVLEDKDAGEMSDEKLTTSESRA